EARVLDERAPARALAPRDVLQLLQLALAASHAGDAGALVAQQELRVGPALVLLAHAIGDGDLHVLEPDLVDLGLAVEHLDGPHRDAGRLHVDEEERDAFLGAAFARGAHEAEDPVGPLAQRVPRLLSVHDVVIALALGARLQRREVRTRSRLRIALAPPVL